MDRGWPEEMVGGEGGNSCVGGDKVGIGVPTHLENR